MKTTLSPPRETGPGTHGTRPRPRVTPDQKQHRVKPSTGWALVRSPGGDPLPACDMRGMLETKLAACLALGQQCPIHPDRIRNPYLRALVACGLIFHRRGWGIDDLRKCWGHMEGPAGSVLLATLDRPVWGPNDYHLLAAIERMETLTNSALASGRTL